jgi:predicted Zn-dependent peptidase
MAVIDSILVSGSDGRFQRVADDNGYGGGVTGGIHVLGNAYNYDGPMLWEFNLVHDNSLDSQQVLAALEAEIARLRDEPVDAGEIRRARAKRLVEFYLSVDNASMRDGIIDLLASFALFDDDPTRINRIEDGFDQVTPELIQATAREYLAPERRTIVFAVPGTAATEAAE